MKVARPEPVTLNSHEKGWLDKIGVSSDAALHLMQSLGRRSAIPTVRLQYFRDPRLNIGGRGKSRKQIFEQKGAIGDAIIRHPHFLNYLNYFIFGPDLPDVTIDGFIKVFEDDRGTSGEVREQLRQFVRRETRRLRLERERGFAEEFFKLSLEIGLDLDYASSIRDAARTAR